MTTPTDSPNRAMFLTQDDIASLTWKARKDAQITVLREMGLVFKFRPNGSAIVLRSYVESLVGGRSSTKEVAKREPQLRL